MQQSFQTIYEGARLTRTPQKIRQIAAISGAIKSVTIEAQNVTLGDYVFNVKKNNVALFSGGTRITINAANKIVTKTGLDISVALGDLISFHLEEAGQQGLLPEIYFIVNIDDGIASGADSAEEISVDESSFAVIEGDNVQDALDSVDDELSALADDLDGKQNTLVSGTNIKTINGTSLLGSGNIAISGGGASALDDLTDVALTLPSSGQVLKFNGTNWVNATDNTGSGGGGSGDTFADLYPNIVAPGALSSFTRQDSSTANNTVSEIGSGKAIRFEASGGSGAMVITKDLPSTAAWTLSIGFKANAIDSGTFWNAGLFLLDSVNNVSKDFHFFPVYNQGYASVNLNSSYGYAGDVLAANTAPELAQGLNKPLIFMRVSKTGTTLEFFLSYDNTIWRSLGTAASNTHTTLIDKVGFICVGSGSSGKAFAEIRHFEIS